MSEELKPCPFCGKPAKWEKKFLTGGIARCSDYRCIGAFTHLSRSASSGEWNTRPAEDALAAEVERLKADNERLKKALEKIEVLTFMPRNKDKVLDRIWHIARAALFTMHKVPANTQDANDGRMKGGEDE